MTDDLSESDWRELATLIAEAPPERLKTAVGRASASVTPTAEAEARQLRTGVDRLLHLAAISSGSAFDRAVLQELRRLSRH